MRTAPRSKNLPVPPLPDCCANTRGTAAVAAAAAPAASMVRLVNPIVGVLFDNRSQSLLGLEAPACHADDILAQRNLRGVATNQLERSFSAAREARQQSSSEQLRSSSAPA